MSVFYVIRYLLSTLFTKKLAYSRHTNLHKLDTVLDTIKGHKLLRSVKKCDIFRTPQDSVGTDRREN